jgi:hypothetical protein
MNAEFATLTLPELADRLEDLDGRRTPVGWTPEDAVERASLERCILEIVAAEAGGATPSLPCPMEVRLRSKERAVTATIREIGPGGIIITTDDRWVVGTHVEIQVRQHDSDEHGLRVRGVIRDFERGAARISVAEQPSEAHERRLRRFILELLRHRMHN